MQSARRGATGAQERQEERQERSARSARRGAPGAQECQEEQSGAGGAGGAQVQQSARMCSVPGGEQQDASKDKSWGRPPPCYGTACGRAYKRRSTPPQPKRGWCD